MAEIEEWVVAVLAVANVGGAWYIRILKQHIEGLHDEALQRAQSAKNKAEALYSEVVEKVDNHIRSRGH